MNHKLNCALSLVLLFYSVNVLTADSPSTAKLFYSSDLKSDGRITLTPGFSPDGKTMYFAQSDCVPIWECPQKLKVSKKTDTGWSTPKLVPLPIDSRVDYPSVTPDGTRLLFSWMVTHPETRTEDSSGNFDLWALDLTKSDAVPKPLRGPDLNRVRAGSVKTLRFVNNETAPIITKSGNLYFWGERLDGLGDRDVYFVQVDSSGNYKEPALLPPPINSQKADDGSWVSADEKTMLITYSDRGGCGGSDIFISQKIEGVWSEPSNLGCDINSSSNEFAATMIPGTSTIVFPSDRTVDGIKKGTIQLWSAEISGF